MGQVRLPSISVVTATFNSGKTLERCFKCVREQNYPQSKIEIVVGDGGSKDNTKKIAKKYKAKIIDIPSERQHAEYNRGVAFNAARNDLVLILDHDNFLPYKNWLLDMVQPFLDHKDIVAVETCYYDYNRKYSLMDRYFALYGSSEPLPFYLNKNDRMMQTSKTWMLQGKARDCGNYYLVSFERNPRKIPSIGTNGCLMNRSIVSKFGDVRPEYHYPIDVMVDVILSGHNKFAFVKNSIVHLTHQRGLLEFLKRRLRFTSQYHFQDLSRRRWSVYMKGDFWELVKYIIYSITFVKPTWDALVGFVQIPDVAWFVQPLMCFATAIMYGPLTLSSFFKRTNLDR